MTLGERVTNLAAKLASRLYMTVYSRQVDSYIHSALPRSPGSQYLLADLSGVLVNSDFVLGKNLNKFVTLYIKYFPDYPRSYPPTFINIGGLQIQEQPDRLPFDILQFMEGAGETGVILFTLGFIFDPSFVPEQAGNDMNRIK